MPSIFSSKKKLHQQLIELQTQVSQLHKELDIQKRQNFVLSEELQDSNSRGNTLQKTILQLENEVGEEKLTSAALRRRNKALESFWKNNHNQQEEEARKREQREIEIAQVLLR